MFKDRRFVGHIINHIDFLLRMWPSHGEQNEVEETDRSCPWVNPRPVGLDRSKALRIIPVW